MKTNNEQFFVVIVLILLSFKVYFRYYVATAQSIQFHAI